MITPASSAMTLGGGIDGPQGRPGGARRCDLGACRAPRYPAQSGFRRLEAAPARRRFPDRRRPRPEPRQLARRRLTGKQYLDFFIVLRLAPDRLQPPADARCPVIREARPRGAHQAVQLGRLHGRDGGVRGDLRAAGDARAAAARLLHRGRRARRRERAQGGLRLEGAEELRARLPDRDAARRCSTSSEAFHGRTGYTLSLTNTDPRKTQYFPKFDWPRVDEPEADVPARRRSSLDAVIERRAASPLAQIERAFARPPGRHRRHHHRADPGRGRRQPLPPRVPPRAAPDLPTSTRRCSSSTRSRPASGSPARVGSRALRRRARHLRLRQEDAGVRHARVDAASTRSTTSSRSRAASTRPGAATWSTWCAPPIPRDHRRGEAGRERRRGAQRCSSLPRAAARVPEPRVERARPRSHVRLRSPRSTARDRLLEATFERELLIVPTGPTGVRFRPSLAITEAELDEGMNRLRDSLEQVRRSRRTPQPPLATK